MHFEPVIGLEVHVQLKTNTKIFCRCSTKFGAAPNSQVCPVCLGLPGVLPVLNERVVEFATHLALATQCHINETSVLARKNYFYPDLPKAYQISQFEEPFCEHGAITIHVEGQAPQKIGITRIHMEEDAGKSLHAESFVAKNETLIDLNRCGTPLLEIVSEPDFRSAREACEYLVKLRQIVVYLGICDGNMEEGSLRCDANVSVRPLGEAKLGTKTELKNMNSFRAVEKAIEYEIHRQEMVLENGGKIEQQTMLWDANRNVAEAMRSKEYSHDYRYFPDPDLVPIQIARDYIEAVARRMPELPDAKRHRFQSFFGLPEYDAAVLTETPDLATYFEKVAEDVNDKKLASNWVMGHVLRALKDHNDSIHTFPVTPRYLAEILQLLETKSISTNSAKIVFDECFRTGYDPKNIVEKQKLALITDDKKIDQAIDQVLDSNARDVQDYLGGKAKVFGFLMGQVMRATQGKAHPQTVQQALRAKLDALKNEKSTEGS
ncbi:Asp-tRNA(Asn)/Glu-tRNA(Gln) amidotransferase subunit GatB [candidate division KSB1 bacterium]|nr:Asp-tRNA(Asn)/Glu-tRNA(Gln) amidotransferase subunit GatB [candidate division KSB1 bacterium]RQW00425.1 MAG: Asp-tRNA(Asn)/Glu-tRNA(Gln) amidotransferase subunit GatB [candidate division KSB1 bacterium]